MPLRSPGTSKSCCPSSSRGPTRSPGWRRAGCEARDLDETLRRQRERIVDELDRHEGRFTQIALDFDEDERRKLQSNMRYWRTRLDQFDRDLEQEQDVSGRSTRCRQNGSSRLASCISGRRRTERLILSPAFCFGY